MTYTVIYRTGTPEACSWWRINASYIDRAPAEDAADDIKQRMGFHAEVRDTHSLDSIGLPIGWDHQSVDWDQDLVEVSQFVTKWIKGGKKVSSNESFVKSLARVIMSLDRAVVAAGGTPGVLDVLYAQPDPLSYLLDIMTRNNIEFHYKGPDK